MKTVVPYGLLTLLLLTLPGWADSEEVRTFTVVTPTVRLEKIVPARTFVGDEFPVEIHVKGLVDAADVVIQDVLPEGTSYLRSEPVGSLEGTSLNWTIRSITAGEKQVIRFVLRAERGGILSACTPMTASRHCCAVTTVGRAQLVVHVTAPESVPLNGHGLFEIEVQNRGTVTAKGVLLTNPIPLRFEHASGFNSLDFQLGDISPGDSRAVPVMLRGVARGEGCDVAIATARNAKIAEGRACTRIIEGILKLSKVGPRSQRLGKHASYAIQVTNTGDFTLTDVTIADLVGEGVTVVQAKKATTSDGFAVWTIPTLKTGETRAFELIATSAETTGLIENAVSATCTEQINATTSAPTVWQGYPGLLFEVVDTNDPVLIGDKTEYRIRVTNQGTADGRNLRVVAEFPAAISPVEASGDAVGHIQGRRVEFPAIDTLEPKRYLEFVVKAVAVDSGEVRARFTLISDVLENPVIEEEATRIY